MMKSLIVVVMIVLPVVVFAGLLIYICCVRWKGDRDYEQRGSGCGECGYPVRGITGQTCPECGSHYAAVGIERVPRRMQTDRIEVVVLTGAAIMFALLLVLLVIMA